MSNFKTYLYLFILFLAYLTSTDLTAAPLSNVPVTLDQPNGTKYKCFATGDEYYRRLHDAEGYTIVYNDKTGWFVYAELSEGKYKQTDIIAGAANPNDYNLPKNAHEDSQYILEYVKEQKRGIESQKIKSKNFNAEKSLNAFAGTFNNLVIFIKFAGETEFTQSSTIYDDMYNAPNTNSVKSYIKEISYNQLTVNSHLYPVPLNSNIISYEDSHPRNYYKAYSASNTIGYTGGDSGDERILREHTLLKNAIEYVQTQIPDTLNIDLDNNNYVDVISFIISGQVEGWASLLWPHQSSLYYFDARIHNKRVYSYSFLINDALLYNGSVGILCHEMFHTIGAPDLYHYSADGLTPVGKWDIMEHDLNPPQHMSAYMKYKYGGWISEIPTISSSGIYSVNNLQSPTNNCWKIYAKNSDTTSPGAFYVLEFRKNSGIFESSLPSSGLIIYRIKPNLYGNSLGPPDEVYAYRKDGTNTINGSYYNAPFSAETGRTKFDSTTNPSPFLIDGSNGGLNIDMIGSSSGSSMSFRVKFDGFIEFPTINTPANNAENIYYRPTFTWNAYNSTQSYQVMVSTVSDFSSYVINQQNILENNLYSPVILTSSTKYYWKVRAKLINDYYSEWSPVHSFTTASGIIIDTVTAVNCIDQSFKVFLHLNAVYNSNNTFTVELSDSNGLFNNPRTIGSMNSTIPTQILCRIPTGTISGNRYKVRVKSAFPNEVSSDYYQYLNIIEKIKPQILISNKEICPNQIVRLYAKQTDTDIINKWNVEGGTILSDSSLPWIDLIFTARNPIVKLKQKKYNADCLDSTSEEFVLKPVSKPDLFPLDTVSCQGNVVSYYTYNDFSFTRSWNVSGGVIVDSSIANEIKVKWDSAGTGRVCLIQTNNFGCSDSTVRLVNILKLPAAAISGNESVCYLNESKYVAETNPNSSYKWIAKNGEIIGSDNLDTVKIRWTGSDLGRVILTQTNNISGCSKSVFKVIEIDSVPEYSIKGSNQTCIDNEYTYTADSIEGYTNTWQAENCEIISALQDTLKVIWRKAGQYKITLIKNNSLGCIDSKEYIVNVNDTPEKPVIFFENNLLTTKRSGLVHEWYFDDVLIVGAVNDNYQPVNEGKYKAIVYENGCPSLSSDEYTYSLQSVFSDKDHLILISPNPAQDVLKLYFNTDINSIKNIEIFDINGSKIKDLNLENINSEMNIDINNLINGIYVLRVFVNNSMINTKFTVLK